MKTIDTLLPVETRSPRHPSHVPAPVKPRKWRARLTVRGAAGLWRYLWLRMRFPNLRVGLFFVAGGAEIRIGPQAQITFGEGICFLRDFSAHFRGTVTIGKNVFFNRGCHVVVYNMLSIGDNCLFGEQVSIHDEEHIVARGGEPVAARGWVTAPIIIGQNVWVGAKATILPGVQIGDNAVIGAHAVVTRDVPANTVAVGVPARVVRKL